MTIETIYNYQYLTNKLATSGQPTEEELVCIALYRIITLGYIQKRKH
jgi:hypothetical protein